MITLEFIVIAFIGGLLTFFSPCVAPLMPGYLSFLAGTSMHDHTKNTRRIAFLTSLAFVLGLATIFSVMGGILTVFLTSASASIARTLEVLGGILIIAFGIILSGLIRIPLLERDVKWHPQKGPSRYPNAFLFGAAFGIGWTPCVGAILGAILTLAFVEPASAFPLLFAFSLGLGIPFLALSVFVEPMTRFIRKSGRAFKIINLIASLLLIGLGVLLITGDFQRIALEHAALPGMTWADDIQDRLIIWLTPEHNETKPHTGCDSTLPVECVDTTPYP